MVKYNFTVVYEHIAFLLVKIALFVLKLECGKDEGLFFSC
jgi:hypothetical protein